MARKIMFVGPSGSGKTKAIKKLEGSDVNYQYKETLGVDITPITISQLDIGLNSYVHKNYNIWDTWGNSKDEHLKLWGKGVDVVIIFGDDQSWYARMKNIFPNVKICYYHDSTIVESMI